MATGTVQLSVSQLFLLMCSLWAVVDGACNDTRHTSCSDCVGWGSGVCGWCATLGQCLTPNVTSPSLEPMPGSCPGYDPTRPQPAVWIVGRYKCPGTCTLLNSSELSRAPRGGSSEAEASCGSHSECTFGTTCGDCVDPSYAGAGCAWYYMALLKPSACMPYPTRVCALCQVRVSEQWQRRVLCRQHNGSCAFAASALRLSHRSVVSGPAHCPTQRLSQV
jgi:hypothetical protein